MSHRNELADLVEENRDFIVRELRRNPIVVKSNENVPKSEAIRAVLESEAEIDMLIAQLRA